MRTIFSVLLHGVEQHGCFIYALVFNRNPSDENVQIINPNNDVWVFVKNVAMSRYHRLFNGMSQMLPFVCLAGLEVEPRSLFVLGKCSTTYLYPALTVLCY